MNKPTLTGEDLHKALQALNTHRVPGPYNFYEVQEAYEHLQKLKVPDDKPIMIPMSTYKGKVIKWMPRYEKG